MLQLPNVVISSQKNEIDYEDLENMIALHRNRIINSISYVDTMDTTITGSRNGLTPLFLWHFIQLNGVEGLRKRALEAQKLARYTEMRLNEIGRNAWRNKDGLTVIFDRPSKNIITKFQLATDNDISHVICVPGITKAQIDELVNAMTEDELVENPLCEQLS